ncbi:MAG: HDOD domain-containing protein [Gammaproteobacteria bacterium]|nr:HDOD domain-containing protein [Gammaproteobacteria bacterium]
MGESVLKLEQESDAQIFVGRQAILDTHGNTYAYELLFRSGQENAAEILDGNRATAQVLINSLVDIGLDSLVGEKLAFVNFTRDSLLNDTVHMLPTERIVVEVLEDMLVDEKLIQEIEKLSGLGYIIALDDFEYSPHWDPIIPLADIIKFDVMSLGLSALDRELEHVKQYDLKLLAEKVETHEEFEHLKALGFDYYQGYFFEKPKVVSGNKMPDNQVALLNLIARLQDPEIDVSEIESLVAQNVTLSYKLLRYINSASLSLPKKVNSIRQVVVYFGLQRLKNWVTLLAMTDLGDKPSELLTTGLIRAKMCELLAIELAYPDSERFFMLGMFSILDALLDRPMPEILDRLPVSEEMLDGLINRQGELGKILEYCIAFDKNTPAGWNPDIDANSINRIHMEAIIWSRESQGSLGN